MWHKPCRTFHPWCPCIKTRCLCAMVSADTEVTDLGSVYIRRADSRFVPSQWETALLCNDVYHWLGASIESALNTGSAFGRLPYGVFIYNKVITNVSDWTSDWLGRHCYHIGCVIKSTHGAYVVVVQLLTFLKLHFIMEWLLQSYFS